MREREPSRYPHSTRPRRHRPRCLGQPAESYVPRPRDTAPTGSESTREWEGCRRRHKRRRNPNSGRTPRCGRRADRLQARHVVDVVQQQVELLRACGQDAPRVLQVKHRFAHNCAQRGPSAEFGARLLREIDSVAAAFQLPAQHVGLLALPEAVGSSNVMKTRVHD